MKSYMLMNATTITICIVFTMVIFFGIEDEIDSWTLVIYGICMFVCGTSVMGVYKNLKNEK